MVCRDGGLERGGCGMTAWRVHRCWAQPYPCWAQDSPCVPPYTSITSMIDVQIARGLLHGTGHNRWYDKTMQFIVFENGQAGFLGEVIEDTLSITRLLSLPSTGDVVAHV